MRNTTIVKYDNFSLFFAYFIADVAQAALGIIDKALKVGKVESTGKLDPERLRFFEQLQSQVVKYKRGNKKDK